MDFNGRTRDTRPLTAYTGIGIVRQARGDEKMASRYIHVGSVTNAMRAKKLLEKNGIIAYINRSAHPAQGDGCGYSLLVTDRDEQAIRILRSAGVRIVRISDGI